MANEIFDKLDEIGTVVSEFQKTNDDRLEKVEKGQESRSKELDIALEKMNKKETKGKSDL